MTDETTAERVPQAAEMGYVVVAMTEERDLLAEDPAVRANGREYVRDSIDAAAAMDDIVDQLSELAPYAGECGVTPCVELLNRFETSVLSTAEQTIDVVDRIDDPACEILLDTFHMNVEEQSPPDAIRAAGDRLGHVHACGNDRGAPGNGHVDWEAVAAALEDVGYDDQAVIEHSPRRWRASPARSPSGDPWRKARTPSPPTGWRFSGISSGSDRTAHPNIHPDVICASRAVTNPGYHEPNALIWCRGA
ncbi:MAG: sugar phosphate isomerase/epimerase family protein [Halobacteriales archaeon]